MRKNFLFLLLLIINEQKKIIILDGYKKCYFPVYTYIYKKKMNQKTLVTTNIFCDSFYLL